MRYFFYILIFLITFSCKTSVEEKQTDAKIVAKAGEENLDVNEFMEEFVSSGNSKDSIYNAKRSIESWAIEALFNQEALGKLNEEELNVEEQVAAYRKSLINYVYETKLIEANLDTAISKQEIENYYNEHRANFILKENIIKVNYFKIPVRTPALPKIKKLLGSSTVKDKEQLKTLCIQNAENFFMNDSTWLFLDDIKKEIPALKEQPDFNLSAGRVVEFTDDLYFYYLKVKDVKVKNGLSPINFEAQNIKKFIINMRKAQLIMTYKKTLLEKAKADKKFILY
ncbi:hypothetical protein CNR22_02625 [Sphingobacteriaceae bacterium]|nr:hypothetical protein CNR22_02625 [Sphingobacteriaceae bacterium]